MSRVGVLPATGRPRQLVWKQRPLVIETVVEHWNELGRWWNDEPECEFYLAHTAGGLFLLCSNPRERQWYARPVQ